MSRVRIAFCYKAGVGKDTACDLLVEKRNAVKLSFAKPLYDILHYAQRVCGFEIKKDRSFLQYIGTVWARHQDPNVWIKLMEKQIIENKDKSLVISDCRFLNELECLRKHGFIIVLLQRPGYDRGLTIEQSQAESEIALDGYSNWDYIIINDGPSFFDKILSLYDSCSQ